MALLFLSGFDIFGPANTNSSSVAALLTAGEWATTTGSAFGIAAGLSSTGFALSLGSGCNVTKTLGTNYARLIGGMRFSPTTLAAVGGVQFLDGASNQAGIAINTTGTISVKNGSYLTGTVLGTSTASVTVSSVHFLEWDITFGNSASYQLWLDGVSILGPSTGDTTATANNTASGFMLAVNTSGGLVIDDLYLFDSTGSTNSAVLLTSPRIETTFPSADSSVQFGIGAAILGSTLQLFGTLTATPAAGSLLLRRFTPSRSCTLNSVSIVPGASNGTANYRGVVYADSGGAAGTLMSSGTTVTGATANTALTLPLTTPQSLTGGTVYWLGFMNDTTVNMQQSDNNASGYRASATFGSGAPGTAPAMTSGQSSILLWGNISGTGVNYYEVGQGVAQGNNSYLTDSTVGHEDLYNFPALSATPANVYAVALKANCSRSDTGARTVSVRMNSAGTDSGGTATGQSPGTSYGWLTTLFETDPHTSAAWTGTALNSATSGIKVDA